MTLARVPLRALGLLLHLLCGLLLAAALRLDRRGRLRPERAMHWWTGRLLPILGIRLQVQGRPQPGARLTVANHVSWLDIPLLGACEPTRFVSKSEVARWPVAGLLAEACGTFYIRRGRGGSRPLLNRLVPHLRGGGSVVVFPEGTTSDGAQVLPFYPRLFAAACEAGCPVQPVAIRYARSADGRDIAPFIGNDDLLHHLLRLLREPAIAAELHYCAPIDSRGRDRDSLCAEAQHAVSMVLNAGSGPAPTWSPPLTAAWRPAGRTRR